MSLETLDTSRVTIDEQITEVKRELFLRARVYGRFVKNGKMTDVQAAIYTLRMQAVLHTLETARKEAPKQEELLWKTQ